MTDLLLLVLFLPLAGGLVLFAFRNGRPVLVKSVGLLTSAATFALSLLLYARFDTANTGFQFAKSIPWIPSLNISLSVGVVARASPEFSVLIGHVSRNWRR